MGSWRDDLYSGEEIALQAEVRRLRAVVRELEEENRELKKRYEGCKENHSL